MPFVVKAGGDFTPAPEGTWPAVCVDVVDKGIVQSAMYKPRHMCQLRWILEAEPPMEDGRPHMAVASFGATLGEKSKLRPFLEAWRGKRFTEDELRGFDVENILGAPCLLQIIHNKYQGKTYANVTSIMPLPKGMKKLEVPADYVRQHIRDERAKLEATPDGEAQPDFNQEAISDDDIPF
jgi:hypothetical protein